MKGREKEEEMKGREEGRKIEGKRYTLHITK